MHPNAQLITDFYTAFQRGDAAGMIACYHPEIEFEDPAFGRLVGPEAGAMWRMLLERSKGNLQVEFSDVSASAERGQAHWEARYPYGPQQRPVHNRIEAAFTFSEGKIRTHHDTFSLWHWSGQALGMTGQLLGWTPLVRNKIRATCRTLLENYQQSS
jgi:ketosteroid isomerase-like protein